MNKKINIGLVTLLVAIILVPQITFASWWNPLSWFSKEKQVEEQKQKEKTTTIPESETQYTDNIETNVDLKAEVATLKANLDSLYTAHNNLVNDHNALLKYVNVTVSPNKSVGVITDNSSLERKVTDLENKLYNVCRRIFSSLGGLGRDNCPSSGLLGTEALESRIKKLENGF